MIDRHNASRDDLIRLVIAQHERITALEAIVTEQRAVIATLEATVTQLTPRVGELLATQAAGNDDAAAGTGERQGMPGLKPTTGKIRPPKVPRKRREQAFVRQRMAPTQQVIHALDACPQCGMPLMGGSVKRTREVIEVPIVPAVVTEHVYLERCCPHCRTRHTPRVELVGEVIGKQRFGVGLVSLIATLREEARLPMATIQWYLATFHPVQVSVGAIGGAIQQGARAAAGMMTQIRAASGASRVAHMDETGWRENGVNGYAWVCARPDAVCFVRGDRSAAMVERLLAAEFAGVLVSDFYVGYAPYVGVKQKCWAHLLRDGHALREAHVDDAAVQAWAAGVHDVYLRAVAWTREPGGASDRGRQAAGERFAQELAAVSGPYVERATPQRVLSARMANGRPLGRCTSCSSSWLSPQCRRTTTGQSATCGTW